MARLLLSKQQYLASGIHIGMKQKTKDMQEFIYKVRPDGLAVLNLRKIDERIRVAAKFLARQKNIVVASRKSVAQDAVKKFGELIGAKVVFGRFMPGMLTNPHYKDYFEADVMFVVDPVIDQQAVEEAVTARVPIVAMCDTGHETRNIDLIIPINNKGKKSLVTVFMLLAREIMKERKQIKSDADFKYTPKDFGLEE